MGLFSKVNCAECGKATNPIVRVRLQDDNCVCASCSRAIPYYAYQSYLERYTLEDFHFFKQYKEYSDQKLRPVFEETLCYYTVHVDEVHDLFYIGHSIDQNTVFLQFENMASFDLIFNPKELKSGIAGQKVEGDVLFQLEMNTPYFKYEDKLAKDVKAKAKKELFGSKVTFENPKGMDDFIGAFTFAWATCVDDSPNDQSAQQTPASELQQAMALFMLDSLEGVTLADLKAHRNRMIKVFHPDKGGEGDTRYAQKINNAYEVLKNYVEVNT